MKYDIVIGLEVHVQLNTKSKLFCSCKTIFGAKANTQTCPVCQGHPGVLPMLNEEVITKATKAGLSLNCKINEYSRFDRKNYFYPDLPKAYQISQYDYPICTDGYIKINDEKQIRVNRIHIEEDAGKLIHSGQNSYVDLNRCGVPLLEIVSEPDIQSSEEAYIYLNDLKNIMEYIDVSDCNMEEGSLRCDANVSLRKSPKDSFGTKVEIKNLNSFKSVQKAIDYEVKRQGKLLNENKEIIQETRLYNADENKTHSMRSKGDSHDYRYFPDPDLVPTILKEEDIQNIKRDMPELPKEKQERFAKEYKLPTKDVGVLSSSIELADFFENTVKLYPKSPKKIANWITAEFMRLLNENNGDFRKVFVNETQIADIVKCIDKGIISGKIAKLIFEDISKKDKRNMSIEKIIEEKGLKLMTSSTDLEAIVAKVIEENPEPVASFKAGKGKAIGFLVGQVMRLTKGQADPASVNKILKSKLGVRKLPNKN